MSVKRYYILLAVFLTLAPFIATTAILAHYIQDDIAFTAKARAGLALHRALFGLQGARGASQATEAAVQAAMNSVDGLFDSGGYTDFPRTREHWARFRQVAPAERGPLLRTMMLDLGTESNLILDPEIEPYYMSSILINVLPDMARHVALLEAGVKTGQDILRYDGSLKILGEKYLYDLSVVSENDPEDVVRGVEAEVKVLEKMHDLQAVVLRGAGSGTVRAASDEARDALSLAYHSFSDHLDWHLQQREQALRDHYWLAWAGAGLALATAALLSFLALLNMLRREEVDAARKVQAIFQTVLDGIVTIDIRGRITSLNAASERLFGYSAEELLGKNVHVLMPEPHHSAHDGYIQAYHRTGRGKIIGVGGREVEGRRKDGTVFPLELSVNAYQSDRHSMFIGMVRDISERRAVQKKLQEYALTVEQKSLELAIARDQAEQATKMKSEFLANMSHEIRTPMNGVIGMTNLLLECDLGPSERRYAETVLNSAEALLDIINDILDFSKIEAGKFEMESISFDAQLMCEEVCSMMALKAGEKGLDLLLRYPHDVPRRFIGDPGRVRQILFNLVNNAIKFTETGHVLVTVAVAPAEGGKIDFRVEVEDTGIGIPEDKLDYIFNKFNQADSSTSRRFGGTGLGLSICRELSRLMGGASGVRSTYGVGSTFWFHVRLDPAPVTEEEALPLAVSLDHMRILVVDDSDVARRVTGEQLSARGAQVTLAASGRAALEILTKDNRFDVAILDALMPEMDGVALARRLSQDPATAAVPLVMLTSAPMRGDRQVIEAAGFSGYLSKPATAAQICDMAAAVAARPAGALVTQHTLREAEVGRREKETGRVCFANVDILLAEDSLVNRTVSTAILERYGCRVTVAENGDEAVRKVKQGGFDLALMDCQMPVMDGYEATGIIRKLEEHQKRPRMPIIAFTAHALKGDDQKCLDAGMDDYISKPVRRAELERVLLRWLPGWKKEGESMANLDPAVLGDLRALMGKDLSVLFGRYLETAAGYVRAIREGAAAGDEAAVRAAAHTLKSSSRQVGALKLADLAQAIEKAGATADLAALEEEWVRTQAAVATARAL